MKTTHHIACYVLAATAFFIASCKKDSNSSISSSKEKLLTSGSWTIQYYEKKNSQGTWVSENDPAMVHFAITFYANNTYAEPSTSSTSTWSANADFSQITLGDGTDAFGTFKVVALTATSLQLENLNPASGELYVYTH